MERLTSHLLVLAQAAAKGAPQAEEPSLLSPWLVGMIVVVLLGVPFLLGALIARALKMKDLSQKIGVVLLVLFLGLSPFVSQYVVGALEENRYEKELAVWKEKQSARDKITAEGIRGLKDKIPGLNVQFDPQKEASQQAPPKVSPVKSE